MFYKNHQVTYAISSANTKVEDTYELKNLNDYLNNFEIISVRDNQTKKLIENIYKGNIVNVCDPTFLLEKSDYKKLIKKPFIDDNYIFLYLFEKLTSKQQEEIRKFASNKKLKIIDGIGYKCDSDFMSINTPVNFLSYMYYANYIITDTFHGTIFSVNFKKNFVSINRNKNKINDFLKSIDLANRLAKNNIVDVLNKEVIYNNQKIEELKYYSIEFLKKCTQEKNKKEHGTYEKFDF